MKDKQLSQLYQQLRDARVQGPATSAKTNKPASGTHTRYDKPELSDDELLQSAMQGVQKRQQGNESLLLKKSSPQEAHRQLQARQAAVGQDLQAEPATSDSAALLHACTPEGNLEWARPGVQERVMKKLRQGLPAWQASIDLHGCTLELARERIMQLLRRAGQEDMSCVRIVHGKGHHKPDSAADSSSKAAQLKTYVNGLLPQLDNVLAFTSALPNEGGTGAVRVLLRRRREQPQHDNPN